MRAYSLIIKVYNFGSEKYEIIFHGIGLTMKGVIKIISLYKLDSTYIIEVWDEYNEKAGEKS